MRFFCALAALCSARPRCSRNPARRPTRRNPKPAARTNATVGGIFPVRYVVQPGEKPRPLAAREKFKVATQNSFDIPAFIVPAFVGGVNLAQARYREFDDGIGAVGKYYGTAFLDQTVATYMASAVFPSVLSPGPALLSPGQERQSRGPPLPLCHRARVRHPRRQRQPPIQPLRTRRQRHRRRLRQSLLPRSHPHRQRHPLPLGRADRHRRLLQHAQRVLPRPQHATPHHHHR